MGDIGYAAILFVLIAGIYTAAIMLWGTWRNRSDMVKSGRRGIWALAFLSTVSALALWYLLLNNDFRYQYVYETTSTFQPIAYHISALWQGQSGSILFWLWSLSLLTAVFAALRRPEEHKEMTYALAILGALQAFFAFLLVMAANPFEPAAQFYTEGFGGNPLLENPGMIYHPPTVLAGYAAASIPFAFALGALIVGRFNDKNWLRSLRPWVILSWLLLSVGILLGAQWAYVELGWGGYWGWDPVENASLIPWLVNTGLLHSLMMQERRGIFKLWNAILIAATLLLCIFATWVTRGNAVNSVHAFGVSNIGDIFFLGLISLLVLTVLIIYSQRKQLRSDFEIQNLSSREGAFLFTILFFSVSSILVLLGTMFPSFSQSLFGRQIAWSTESYDRIARTLMPFLLVLLGVCPILGWRRTEGQQFLRALMLPLAVGIVTGLLVVFFGGGLTYAALAFALISFVIVTLILEFYRGWRLRMGKGEGPLLAIGRLFSRSRRRYGGYLVHLGILLMLVGITGQALYQSTEQVALAKGESVSVGPYTLQYETSGTEDTTGSRRFYTLLQVYQNDRPVFTLQPEKNFYWNVEQWVTEIALHTTLTEDLYVILSGLEDNGLATIEVLINPLMIWLWIGGIVLVIGTLIAVWPVRRKTPSVPATS